jgi:hypothetical protein
MQYTIGKMFSKPFQRYITNPQISKVSIGKTKKKLQSFNDYIAGWSKEPQWENDNGSFLQWFLQVY